MAKILIVEDDAFLSDLYFHTFSFSGFDTHVARDGLEGLEKVQEVKPDLILLDIMMPKMNGLEVIRKLKEDVNTKSIPVVILSNFSDEALAKEAMSQGAIAYIIKSEYEPKQVIQMVTEWLSGKTSTSS
jgi:twitching motility two-component system response regulator PilH